MTPLEGVSCRFFGVISKSPEIGGFGGVGVDIIRTLHRYPSSKVAVHYPSEVKNLNLEELLMTSS